MTKTERAALRRSAMLREGFTVGDGDHRIHFRALPGDIAITLSSFGLGWFAGEADPPPPPEDESDTAAVAAYNNLIFHQMMVIAWTLWAPPETVIDLALDFDEAASKTATAKCERELRKQVRLFQQNYISLALQAELFRAMWRLFEEIRAADFALEDAEDAPESPVPPGNSSSQGE